MRPARRSLIRTVALPLGIGLLAFTAIQRKASGTARCLKGNAATEQCRRSAPVKGSELIWESVSRGIGSAVAL
ncbi:hypothetical protein [Flaviaesturariibacter amylovorans]|uniref:Uncharacterized protein n=1 Tax=Flaviaesturariibacter amylovorans TaxID=1084520 RepID=A0ABP8G4S3_9BACT